MEFVEKLLDFGLTRQEATIYEALLLHGEVTGYEVAKLTGISRSNTYNALAGLVEKGAAYIIEGQVTKYTPVEVKDFSTNIIRNLTLLQKDLMESAPEKQVESEGYVTIKGRKHVMNQLYNMFEKVEHRVYILANSELLESVRPKLIEMREKGNKVVIITDSEKFQMEGIIIHYSETAIHQFGIIIDSVEVLTGDLKQGENIACLYSKNSNFVAVFKEMLSNKIRLIILQGGNEQ